MREWWGPQARSSSACLWFCTRMACYPPCLGMSLSVPASSGVCLFREGTALWREAAENGVLQRALSGDRGGSK